MMNSMSISVCLCVVAIFGGAFFFPRKFAVMSGYLRLYWRRRRRVVAKTRTSPVVSDNDSEDTDEETPP